MDQKTGLGIVVPHRAQRAALQQAFPELNELDPVTGTLIRSAVDTVERFQAGERHVILVSATESDRKYSPNWWTDWRSGARQADGRGLFWGWLGRFGREGART